MKTKTLTNWISTHFPENPDYPEGQPRRIYAVVLILVGAPFILPFSVQDLMQRNYIELTIELIVLAALAVLVHFIRRGVHPAATYRAAIGLFSLLLITIVINVAGSPQKLYWLFIYPPISFFVLGRKEGFFWNIGFLVLTYAFLIFDLWRFLNPTEVTILDGKMRFFVSYFIVAASSYAYSTLQQTFSGRILRERALLRKQKQRMLEINRQMRKMSITDPLTGAYNRGYMHSRLMKEVARADRYSRPLSIVMLDIDHFKRVNDTFGHQAGDAVLKEIVHRLNTTMRNEIDWVARYGGEEFLIVLPETEQSGAVMLAERVRISLAEAPFAVAEQELTITGSFGVAFWRDEAGNPRAVESFINLADERLYNAKRDGRNRVAEA